ncbi:DUF7657 domain-containing protein [Luteimonas granuli]|uniref:YfhO family protein n=1 Tax=Luteimonas granuli TaxID=1176533 RepID=A0A518N319_9GAMM|nr:hypothetical protein [Luteimonas granuli]QDW66335.1 hypothetical protein FPZ22_05025 [Luteimonas granuli]
MTSAAAAAKPPRGRALPRTAAILAVAALLAWLFLLSRHELRVNLEFSATAPGPGEIFHAAEGEEFSAGKSVSFATVSDGTAQKYRVDIASSDPVSRLRLDPATGPGAIALHGLQLRGKVLWLKTARADVPLEPASAHHAGPPARDAGGLRFETLGNDPWLEIRLPPDTLSALERRTHGLRLLAALLCGFGVVLLDIALRFALKHAPRVRDRARRWMARLEPAARACSDEGTIVFTPASFLVVALGLSLAAAGVAGRINLSSAGMWDAYLPTPSAGDSLLVGEPRAIRTDEWLVHTPWMLSQAANGYPLHNPAIGALNATLLTSVPVRHPITAFQPEFWGFALFDVERAVSWFWMYKTLGLFLSAFLLLLLLTRGDAGIAFLGSAWLCLSSFTQWWFSTNLPEILVGLCLTLLGFLSVCLATRRATFAFGVLAFLLGAATFAFQLYPAFQVPLAYAAAAIVAGVALARADRARFRHRAGLRLGALAACAAVLAVLLYRFAVDAAATIEVVSATVYPGQRSTVGGSMPWRMAFDGVFEGWRFGETDFPYVNSNASESSDYIVLFPLVVAAMLWHGRRALKDGLLVSLATFCLLLAAWMTIALPDAAAQAVSRLLLLSFVPPPRASVALGVASVVLVTVWMARLRAMPRPPLSASQPAFAAIAAVLAWAYGLQLQEIDPAFFTRTRLLLGTALVALGAWAIVRGSRLAFALFVVALSIPGTTVNPVSRGLAPLLEKPVLAAAVAASEGERPARWIVVGSFVLPQAFKAVGLDVLGGATFAPDHEVMRVLDPDARSAEVWNRYAHIQVESDASLEAPAFDLVQADLYRLRVDVCAAPLEALGINRLAYPGEAPEADLACLRRIGEPVQGFSLYARVADR